MDDPILMTGCARSGTSMTAGVVNICGAFGGNMSGPTRYNEKGMFENTVIRNKIVKPYLQSIGADKMGQKPLPDIERVMGSMSDEFIKNWRQKVINVIKNDGYKGGPWFYKGAKMCLFWPVWKAAFPDAKWIIVRRKSDDIVNSCMRTGFMRAYREESGWHSWVNSHLERFLEMQKADLNIKCVWPQKMIISDFSEIRSVIESLGLEFKEKEIKEFISPELWKRGKNGKGN